MTLLSVTLQIGSAITAKSSGYIYGFLLVSM